MKQAGQRRSPVIVVRPRKRRVTSGWSGQGEVHGGLSQCTQMGQESVRDSHGTSSALTISASRPLGGHVADVDGVATRTAGQNLFRDFQMATEGAGTWLPSISPLLASEPRLWVSLLLPPFELSEVLGAEMCHSLLHSYIEVLIPRCLRMGLGLEEGL